MEDSYVDSEQPSGTPMEYENKFYFFPGLISAERPVNVWSQQDSQDWGYCCGWCIQCKPQQFLTTRFLQVLLLRLVFKYAAVINKDSDLVEGFSLKRRCEIWKNGTQWCNRRGVEVLVEVTEQISVVLVLMRSLRGQEMECVKLRSVIIGKVLAAKEKFCPRVEVKEYFINPSDLTCYPNVGIRATVQVEMREVANTVRDATPCILYHQSKTIQLDRLLHFEPYSALGKSLLTSLFDPENTKEKVPPKVLQEISSSRHHALLNFVCMLEVRHEEFLMQQRQWPGHPSKVLLHIFEYWQMTKNNGGTYQELREQFDKYSIFCGRNPLNVCTHEFMSSWELQKGSPGVQ